MAPVRAIPSPAEFFAPLKGFAELIKDQPWCACGHCQSVLSPAAYFVDLMFYIEQYILERSFKGHERHQLHLQTRRPDLWDQDLSCKNTDEYVPYLDLVNEILERYLRETVSIRAESNLYEHLAEQAGSFQQPFTMPLERLELLLGHFGLSRYAITKAMGADRTTQVRARLRLSQLEHDLITVDLVWRQDERTFHARNPFPVGGVVEDPATGAAAAAFGAYLRELGAVAPPADLTILQGEDMGRPSTLLLHVDTAERPELRVSGTAVPIEAP